VVDLVRGDVSLRQALDDADLRAGEIVVLATQEAELMGFRDGTAAGKMIAGTEPSAARRTAVVEVLVGPNTRAVHRMIGRLHWRRRVGVYPMALHRDGTAPDMRLSMMRLAVGDTLLLATVRPIVALLLVYALTSILTELMTNNAVAVLMALIAAGVVLQLGLDPRPFVVAVMFGASASFATPIGYQTNTLVNSLVAIGSLTSSGSVCR